MALVIPVILFVLFAQQYLFYFENHNAARIRRFYQEEENSLDVVILGASEVFNGFAPPLAYDEYGFTSYMYAIDSNSGALYTPQLKEILSTQTPQKIFIEINDLLYDDSQIENPVQLEVLRIFTENIPFSRNKLETIRQFGHGDTLGDLLPFTLYHKDWTLGTELIDRLEWRISTSRTPSFLKGVFTHTVIDRTLPEDIEISEEQKSTLKVGERRLNEILQFCQDNQLDNVVFVRFPHKNAHVHEHLVRDVAKYVQDRGYTFLNLEDHKEAIGLDPLQDYYNAEHLNIYGQKKLTTYLGNMIIQDFKVSPMAQSEENRLNWETSAAYYNDFYTFACEKIAAEEINWLSEENIPFKIFLDWRNQKNAA